MALPAEWTFPGARHLCHTRCHVTSWTISSWTVRSWTGLGLAACHFLDLQILDWVRVRVRVRVAVQELTVQELSGSLAIILTSLTTRPTYNPGALKVTAGLEESDDSLLLGLYGFGHLQESCSRSDEHWNDAHIQCGTFIFFFITGQLG